MNQEEIKAFLPHREPMLLVDTLALDEEGQARGEYLVRGDEPFLQGHFPGFPVVPGVVLCEIIAQSAGILVREKLQEGLLPLFVGMEKVRFRRMVRPGDRILTTCRLLRRSGMMVKIAGEAWVEGEVCAEGAFLMILSDAGK
ncbi:MAG: 3-hydroxyacyl-ACP dehydratase FabZ [Eubacteriales bacterium]|nr:3-hydroxyacyl-ACP dehydratase FabZ [Eubacteriales bacterium]